MRGFSKIRLGLAAKLAVCVIASTAAFFTIFGYINLKIERTHSENLVKQAADRVADIILRSTRYQMLKDDREALIHVVQDVGTEPGIQRIRISNEHGRVTLATDPRDLNTMMDLHADRVRIIANRPGERVLEVTRPIDNGPSCSSAACHVHPAGQQVLGVINADLSLATVDAQLSQHQSTLKWFLAGAVLFGCGAAVLFMWVFVYRPVRRLMDGTHRVAGGDLEYRIPVHSDDELGDLAASFNKMTAEVAGVQAQIEEQVRRKTAELERVYKTLLGTEKLASIGKLAATGGP